MKLSDFAGLRVPKSILSKVAQSPYQSAWLLVGPAGTGKTTMAYAFAAEIGAQVHHIASKSCNLETVTAVCQSCAYVPMFGANSWHVVIVDEADRMTDAAQLAFLSKLDSTEFPPQTIFIFTANSTEGLEPRFQSRCRILKFEAPESSLLKEALAFIWKRETSDRRTPDVSKIVMESRGNFRDALMRLELAIMLDDEPETEQPAEVAPIVEQQIIKPVATARPAYGSPEWWKLQNAGA
jgi:DNA polymerase III delta prime subunit